MLLSKAREYAFDGAEAFEVSPTTGEAVWVSRVDQDLFDSYVKPLVSIIFNLPFTETL